MAIPKNWKDILLKNEPDLRTEVPTQFKVLFSNTKQKPSRFCYLYYANKEKVSNSALVTIWNNNLKIRLTTKDLSRLFVKIKTISKCTKLQFFQYRLLIKALTTNVRVAKWDQNVSDKCTFCQTSAETTLHLFWECPMVKKLWKAFTKWCVHFYSVNIQFTAEMVLLCNYIGRKARLINFLILIIKFYIYKTKVQGGILNFQTMVKDISKYQGIEKCLAFKYDALYKYASKWEDFTVFD